MAFVYAVVFDLFFADRIGNALTQLGHRGQVVDLSQAMTIAVPADADLVLIDLEAGEQALAAIRSARDSGRTVLAFGPHTDLEMRRAGLDAGAHKVVAKSKLTSSFADLITEMTRVQSEQG